VKAEEILAASTAIPRLRKEIEALQQEAYSLDSMRQEANLRAAQSLLEQGKVSQTIIFSVFGFRLEPYFCCSLENCQIACCLSL
jgi:hypothetical protein